MTIEEMKEAKAEAEKQIEEALRFFHVKTGLYGHIVQVPPAEKLKHLAFPNGFITQLKINE